MLDRDAPSDLRREAGKTLRDLDHGVAQAAFIEAVENEQAPSAGVEAMTSLFTLSAATSEAFLRRLVEHGVPEALTALLHSGRVLAYPDMRHILIGRGRRLWPVLQSEGESGNENAVALIRAVLGDATAPEYVRVGAAEWLSGHTGSTAFIETLLDDPRLSTNGFLSLAARLSPQNPKVAARLYRIATGRTQRLEARLAAARHLNRTDVWERLARDRWVMRRAVGEVVLGLSRSPGGHRPGFRPVASVYSLPSPYLLAKRLLAGCVSLALLPFQFLIAVCFISWRGLCWVSSASFQGVRRAAALLQRKPEPPAEPIDPLRMDPLDVARYVNALYERTQEKMEAEEEEMSQAFMQAEAYFRDHSIHSKFIWP
jgi:hypothetical protein